MAVAVHRSDSKRTQTAAGDEYRQRQWRISPLEGLGGRIVERVKEINVRERHQSPVDTVGVQGVRRMRALASATTRPDCQALGRCRALR